MRGSKTNHKPADMQQAYPEANTELVEQVSKMTSKHEKERAREEPDKRTIEKAGRYVCWDVLVGQSDRPIIRGTQVCAARSSCCWHCLLARLRLSATGTACVPPLTSLCYPPTIIRAFGVCDPHVMRSSKTNHKPADMQQAYPEANTELVEQVSKMTSKHEKEREREESDKRTNEKADRCVCWDVLVAHSYSILIASHH
jgi:hypothetical protein